MNQYITPKLEQSALSSALPKWKTLASYLAAVISAAIVTLLSCSCTAGIVIGRNQKQHQENNVQTRADSAHVSPTITIR